jgi:hypothetical protein
VPAKRQPEQWPLDTNGLLGKANDRWRYGEEGGHVGDRCEVDDDCAPIEGEPATCRTEWEGVDYTRSRTG